MAYQKNSHFHFGNQLLAINIDLENQCSIRPSWRKETCYIRCHFMTGNEKNNILYCIIIYPLNKVDNKFRLLIMRTITTMTIWIRSIYGCLYLHCTQSQAFNQLLRKRMSEFIQLNHLFVIEVKMHKGKQYWIVYRGWLVFLLF